MITSLQNPNVKRLYRLRNRRERDETQTFLIEGYRELLRAKEGNADIETIYFCRELFLGSNEDELMKGFACEEVSKNVFEKISYRDRPDGLIGIAKQKHLGLDDLPKTTNPFFVVAEAIEKPGNLGSMLRSCDAAGVDALILCDKCTDIYNPNVVRASVGTLFTVPVIEACSKEAVDYFRGHGITVLAGTPDTDVMYTDVDMTGPVAIAVGTEQYGLSDQWMRGKQVKIPMHGNADSLNVTVAATLLMYEVVRQRGNRLL